MSGRQRDPVVVVGAGPTGLTVAGLLARYGIACTVVDRYPEPYARPRAVHLDGESVRILQGLGVHEGFAAISRPAAGLRLLDARLRPFAEFRRSPAPGPHGHPEANLFDQPELEALLRAGPARHPSVTLRGGLGVTAVEEDGDALRVTMRHTATGVVEHVRAAAVLGCDGAGSTVRDTIGARFRDLGFTERWLVVDVRCGVAIGTWGGVDQVCDPRRAATFMHLAGDRYRWEFRMRPGENAEDLTRPQSLAALTAPWLRGVPAREWEMVRSAVYTFRGRVADRWRRGRVLLLGDAAHLTPPFIGQGLGAGLRDAHNLAWKLAAVLDDTAAPARAGIDPEALLDSYQAERAPHVEAMIRTAIRVGRAMTGGNGVVAALRRPVVATLLRLPGAEARALAGITTRHPPGPWADRRAHRGDLAGTLCPQPDVVRGGRIVRLDDVLGDGFALLHTGPVDAGLLARARALGARTVRLAGDTPVDDPTGGVTVADDGTLHAWLVGGRTTAVLLRPDHVVLASAPPPPVPRLRSTRQVPPSPTA